jgi:hypothetical protein
MANDHVDSAMKIDAPSTQTAAPQGKTERKAIDNDAQAAEVEQRREHVAGGGGDANPAPEDPGGAAAAAIERATQRVRAADRPSPFGVAQFPPLPQP